MTGPLFSASWYRVAGLTPRLRSHAQIHRHRYRGQTWFILQDRSSERFHRFSPAGYFVIGLMDGRRTVQEIWDAAAARLGDDAPTQDEMIHLLSQLHAADVLQCEVPPDTVELLRRHEKQQRRKWQSQLLSLFAWRLPVLDPERFLVGALPAVRPLVGWPGAILWLLVVGPALVLAAVHWPDLTHGIMDRLLAQQNLAVLWILFPLLKILHEFGHAFAAKALGGEVHDMGITLLVLTPVPYVDASSSWAFRSKWQRIAVGAAGMAVELFVAAIALYVWLAAQPGAIRTVAYNAVLISGISTLFFNANPLVRFDGYYILADFLEIPNLRQRSNAFFGFLCERYLFGRREAEPPPATPGERAWFVGYGIAAAAYRVFIAVAILLFIAGQFLGIGLLVAALGALTWAVIPLAKAVAFLFANPRIRKVRARALAVSALIVAVVVWVLVFVPVPLRTRAEGIIWIPDEAFVRPATEGFVERVVARPGDRVRRGDVLFVCTDPVLSAKVRELEARLRELEARYREQAIGKDRVKAAILEEERRYVLETLANTRRRLSDLVIRAGADGTFVAPLAPDLPGRFVRKGEVLAHVVDLAKVTVRTMVGQDEIDLLHHRTQRIHVRLAERLAEPFAITLSRVVPGATEQLPSPALGSQGGGQIAVDPVDTKGVRAVQRYFQVDLEMPTPSGLLNVGGRAYVRFDHGREPLAFQWYRSLRQLFLARLNL